MMGVLIPRAFPRRAQRNDVVAAANLSEWSLITANGDKIYEVQFAERSLKQIGKLPKPAAKFGSISFSADGKWIAYEVCTNTAEKRVIDSNERCASGSTHLAIVAADGTGLREFSNLAYPAAMCWSPDNSKIVLLVSDRIANRPPSMNIVDVSTGSLKSIDSMNGAPSEQCWSPDGKKIVYRMGFNEGVQVVRVYDVAEDKHRDITSGDHPSWSPDGERIAYLDCPPTKSDCVYRTIHPDGSGQALLFKIDVNDSPLWWSPDSQFVVYRSFRKFSEESLAGKLVALEPVEHLDTNDRLRIRRLADNSEDWLLNLGNDDPGSFQWIRRTLQTK
jgi:Tol biopolymer transport system component